jgi:hypothetical protein
VDFELLTPVLRLEYHQFVLGRVNSEPQARRLRAAQKSNRKANSYPWLQGADGGFPFFNVHADGAGEHQRDLDVFPQDVMGVLGVADLEDLMGAVPEDGISP